MKKLLYKAINNLGYSIENKKNKQQNLIKPLLKFSHLDNFNLLILAKNYILNLDDKFDDFILSNDRNGFIISFGGLSIYVESLEEFHILNEVFISDDYRFFLNKKSILIDIGTNIGIASLFFSKYEFIEEIYAFEPVKDTFDQAQYNFKLNKKKSKVVGFKNVGLGKDERKETFLFDSKVKGNTGLRGSLSPSYSNNNNVDK